MADASRFWDRIAERYAKRPISDQAAYEKKLEITRAFFTPETEALELGCGTGSTAIAHAPYVKSIRAFDFAPKMLEIARERAAKAGVENVSFDLGDAAQACAGDQRYDVVLALNLIHLLPDWEAAIQRVRRVLKPGGAFVSSTACIADIMPVFRYIAPVGHALGVLPQLAVFSEKQYMESLAKAGFTVERRWSPGKRTALFVVATAPAATETAPASVAPAREALS